MISCTRRFRFEAAHRLFNYKGRCADLHGHGYLVEVTVSAPGVDDQGMVVDFGCLKKCFGEWLNDNWDHATILYEKDPIAKLWYSAVEHRPFDDMRFFALPYNPTAENMARYLFELGSNTLFVNSPISVDEVKIWETVNCCATVRKGG